MGLDFVCDKRTRGCRGPPFSSPNNLCSQLDANSSPKQDHGAHLNNKTIVCLLSFEGPAFWGLMNPEWAMCNRGRRQSPINIEPSQLLFDPNLRPLHVDKNPVSLASLPFVSVSLFLRNSLALRQILFTWKHFEVLTDLLTW